MRYVVAFLLFVASTTSVEARVIRIPAEQPDLQMAMQVASWGDTLLLAPGVYGGPGNQGFQKTVEHINIISEAGPEATVIDLAGGFFIHPEDPEYSTLPYSIEGITFRGGADAIIFGTEGPRRVHNCILEHNQTGLVANILYTEGVIDSCVFRENVTGILLADEAYQLVRGNLFIKNQLALDVRDALNSEIVGNVIAYNGWGVKRYTDFFTFTDNVVYANDCGVEIWEVTGPPRYSYNDVFANYWDYCDSIDYTGVDGNISVDPMFCDSTLATGMSVYYNSPLLWSLESRGISMGNVTGGCTCCQIRVGDANGQGGDEPTIGDISVMIDARFITGSCILEGPNANITCLAEADINQSGGVNPTCDDITIGDIAILIYSGFVVPFIILPDCLSQ